VRELCAGLPEASARRIARATVTFKDVFTVAATPRLAELSAAHDEAAVDAVLAARLIVPEPSREAIAVAWAGGLLHARQAARVLGVLDAEQATGPDRDVLRWNGLKRLADPASPRLAAEVQALSAGERRTMATVLLDEALAICEDPDCGLIDKMAAAQAAHRVRDDLVGRDSLPHLQRELVAGLEELGERATALDVAVAALEEWPPGGRSEDRDWLSSAVLRLSRLVPPPPLPPGAVTLIDEAISSGAATALEARIWAAIGMLDDPDQHEAALDMAVQAAATLDARATVLGEAGTRWRLLLAFHIGRAGHPAMTAQFLALLLNSADPEQQDAASAVLHATAGPRADTRLQNILLEAELATLPPDAADDRLRIHHALAENHHTLGQYHQALIHGMHELELRHSLQGPDHPYILMTRGRVALWTGLSGNLEEALRLSQALLPDRVRVLGANHPETLAIRNDIAGWTGDCGNRTGALRLFQALLPDRVRVLGTNHPDMLATRNNIAYWTAQCGNLAEALRLFQALLPDRVRVLGTNHPDTVATPERHRVPD
jgi:hypothetical protein